MGVGFLSLRLVGQIFSRFLYVQPDNLKGLFIASVSVRGNFDSHAFMLMPLTLGMNKL